MAWLRASQCDDLRPGFAFKFERGSAVQTDPRTVGHELDIRVDADLHNGAVGQDSRLSLVVNCFTVSPDNPAPVEPQHPRSRPYTPNNRAALEPWMTVDGRHRSSAVQPLLPSEVCTHVEYEKPKIPVFLVNPGRRVKLKRRVERRDDVLEYTKRGVHSPYF